MAKWFKMLNDTQVFIARTNYRFPDQWEFTVELKNYRESSCLREKEKNNNIYIDYVNEV